MTVTYSKNVFDASKGLTQTNEELSDTIIINVGNVDKSLCNNFYNNNVLNAVKISSLLIKLFRNWL